MFEVIPPMFKDLIIRIFINVKLTKLTKTLSSRRAVSKDGNNVQHRRSKRVKLYTTNETIVKEKTSTVRNKERNYLNVT